MRHISTLRLTTKSLDKSFVFKKSVVEKGLAERAVTGLGAGGPPVQIRAPRPILSTSCLLFVLIALIALER